MENIRPTVEANTTDQEPGVSWRHRGPRVLTRGDLARALPSHGTCWKGSGVEACIKRTRAGRAVFPLHPQTRGDDLVVGARVRTIG